MSVENIFRQLNDRATWPPPPERPLRPFDVAEMRPAVLVPVAEETLLQRWTPDDADARGGAQ